MSLARKSTYNSGYDPYKTNEISTMSQGKLVVMLYDGAIRFCNTAIENMTPRKYEIVNRNIIKAQDIITELMTSLNLDQGGKIAEDLLSLYIYMKKTHHKSQQPTTNTTHKHQQTSTKNHTPSYHHEQKIQSTQPAP